MTREALAALHTRSITRQLTTVLLATIVVVSAVAVTAMQQVLSRAASRALDRKADETLAYLVAALELPLWSMDEDGVKTVGRAVSQDESIVRVIVRDESGAIVYSTGNEAGGELTSRVGKIFHKELSKETLVGDVALSLAPTVSRENERRLLQYSMLIMILLLISVAMVTVVFFRAFLSRPLKRLDEIAIRFAHGTYDTPDDPLPYLEFQPFGRTLAGMAKKIEEQIRVIKESEAKYRRIVDTAAEGIWVLGPNTLTTFVNPRMAEMLGYSGEEMIGRRQTDFMFEEDAADQLQELENRRGGAAGHYERRFRRHDGEALWTLASATPILDEGHHFMGAFAMFTDITDRKQAEEALRASEERMRLFFERQLVGMAITSPEKGWIQVNDKICEMLGYSREELSRLTWAELTYPEDLALDVAQFARILSSEIDSYMLEKRFVRKDGRIVFTNLAVGCVRRPDRSVDYVLALLEDITKRKHVEEEVRQLNQELQRRVLDLQAANRELETMTYSVSHDLRQPLRTIDGFLGLLKKHLDMTLDDQGRRYMTTISEAALRMARLIDALLSFSRSGRFEMDRVPVDLEALAQEVVRELEPTALGRLVEWRVGELPVVSGDRAMLRMVFGNLLSNAVKFTQPRLRAEIEVGCLPGQDEEIVIFVRDNGVGFDAQYAHKLFLVFERLHGVEEFDGTGIGLASVRRVVARHGGRTWAEGKVEGGATFYFSLPRRVSG